MSTEARYKQFFLNADSDKSGYLTFNELAEILKNKGYKGSEVQLKKIFRKVDSSGDNKISYEEYMIAMGQIPEQDHKNATMRAVFRQFDKNDSGTIDKDELRNVFGEMGKHFSQTDIQKMIKLADRDGSGTLNYEEFIKEVFGA